MAKELLNPFFGGNSGMIWALLTCSAVHSGGKSKYLTLTEKFSRPWQLKWQKSNKRILPPAVDTSGTSLEFQNCGCRLPKKLKIKGIFVQKLRVKNQIFEKSEGTESVFLKICGCSCTHTNEGPVHSTFVRSFTFLKDHFPNKWESSLLLS